MDISKIKLTKEEKKIQEDMRKGRYVSVSFDPKNDPLVKTAQNTVLDDEKVVEVEVPLNELKEAKKAYGKKKTSFSTLVSRILKKYVNERQQKVSA